MIQVCDPPRTRQVRRLSTEEFCQLVRGEVSCVYRPRSEVLRMLTVGEAWGTGGVRGAPGAGCILLPMDADVAAAAALRSFLGWGCTAGGYFLTPAAGLIRYFRGDHLVVINMQPTGADAEADLCIAKPIGQVLSEDVTLDL